MGPELPLHPFVQGQMGRGVVPGELQLVVNLMQWKQQDLVLQLLSSSINQGLALV